MKFVFYIVVALWFSAARADAYVDFFRAVNLDDARTVNQLLARGFDPNARDERGQVALFVALRAESPKVAAVLLAHADLRVDAPNDKGETPLMMAALRGQRELAAQLIARGAAVNREGWTPLHYAASGPQVSVVRLLLERGAEVDARSPNRTTPLMMAAGYGPEESVLLLLERGANPRLRNDQDLGIADFARLSGRERLTERLETLPR